MKKKISLALAVIMSISALTAGVSAADYTQVNLLVEGKSVETDQPAVIVDSRTMVPVRVIAESLGSEVDWDADTKTVTFTYDDMTAAMEIGGKELKVKVADAEQVLPIDVPATIINSRTMVPVRFLSETFGYVVDWDAETKTVNVKAADKTDVEDVTTTPAAVEETKDEVKDEAKDEVKVADAEAVAALKADALVVDGYASVLNDLTKKMSKAQADTYTASCDDVATVLKMTDSAEMTEDEVKAGTEKIAQAKGAMEVIAEELKVDLTK